jgi:hypothetical protein
MLGERGLDLARRSEVECVMRQCASKAGVRGRSDAHLRTTACRLSSRAGSRITTLFRDLVPILL